MNRAHRTDLTFTPWLMILCAFASSACTQQTPNSFRLQQQLERFAAATEINTRVDLLFVIDNSASMDVSQDRLRRGFASFAQKYLRPNWDIRVAAITTDTYMAHPAFQPYLATPISSTTGWASPYVKARLATFVNPTWDPTLVSLSSGIFGHGLSNGAQVPAWGPDYARLLPGLHDGPIAAFCSEKHPYFFAAASQCKIRDNQTVNTGPAHCLSPSPGETAITQCVNTVENDTIHSGRPILSTQSGSATLLNDFMINASVGSSGSGSERGLSSLLQLLMDNETTQTQFFRPNTQRIILFLSDEDDQSMTLPSIVPSGFSPFTNYSSTCPTKTVDGYSYRIGSCPDSSKLISIATVKGQLDSFFSELDNATGTPDSYLIIPIVALTGASIQNLQQLRAVDDLAAGSVGNVAVDRGDRYLQLASQVGNGSFSMNIDTDDYSQLLDQVGRAIVTRKSVFNLNRTPTGTQDMIVTIIHQDGSETAVASSLYSVSGNQLTMNNQDFVLSLSSTDRILVNYQPKSVL